MAVNKVIYGNKTLIDLTNDTITADALAEGYTAHDQTGAEIVGTNTYDADTQDATATQAEILDSKIAYARGQQLTGTMINNGAVTGNIDTIDGVYNIPVGYHDGSGIVAIDEIEAAKLIPSNIRDGVEILGVLGIMLDDESVTSQVKTVTPSTEAQYVLPDENHNYLSEVIVEAIPYTETENSAGGITVTIG